MKISKLVINKNIPRITREATFIEPSAHTAGEVIKHALGIPYGKGGNYTSVLNPINCRNVAVGVDVPKITPYYLTDKQGKISLFSNIIK